LAKQLGEYARFLIFCFGFGLISACSQPYPAGAAPYAAHVMDARTGETLFAENADTRLHPASLTKMMTLYIAFQEIEKGNISLDTMITVSANASSQPPSRLGLKTGQKIALRYLIRAAAVKSANDAASAIGDAIGGDQSGFANRMTKTAKALGMKNTTFKNANGLTSKGHLSTAHDMSILGRRLFYDFPQYYNIFSRRSTDAGLATVNNTNRRFLDAYPGADGIKTGYTDAAGFNLTASAERDGVRIIATVLGGKSTADRNAKMAKLLDLGFAKAPANAQVNVPTAPVIEGADDEMLLSQIDESLPEVEGGAGKTLRVAMNPATSPRPIARPTLEEAGSAAEVVASLDAGINAALTEATTLPPKPGTLEYQSAALDGTLLDGAAQIGTEIAADDGAVDAAGINAALAAAGVEIDIAIAEATKPLTISAAAPTQTVALIAALRPPKRNKPIYDNAAATAETVALADAGAPAADIVSDAQLVAADPTEIAMATAEPEPEPEVVTRVSTSGGRQFGINVGSYPTSYDAERAVLQMQLNESATLWPGLRKVVQRKGGYEANIMGLTQQEADLACRKLVARNLECTTIGA
jgi:D-alanyl-D-alanine carboxypeptidase